MDTSSVHGDADDIELEMSLPEQRRQATVILEFRECELNGDNVTQVDGSIRDRPGKDRRHHAVEWHSNGLNAAIE
eukprot:CAMPEP_0181168484 /NCGR_PEP_ID=MMETSP1096-20121128/298_1 /TAXON_ID=156174 ORGANISM="Chrysochromulina ericina, Strain CCMP281" /NCGR_SAMPLE_ID=MMETSP1096 /ASSEMBLY_ACC=CAM_ASM_000453 /LENGTH=74 /DNA_ID=CAMNT_0023255863 /DNA_START=332 /DNA_END=556 /DNA_ORIENTATION=-